MTVGPERARSGILVGTAGWSLPRAVQGDFPGDGPHLARYARVFPAVEINTSFHRPHRPSIYERWGTATPESFRFCLKLPKTITHGLRLAEPAALLDAFLAESATLGTRRACLLVQLPPSLELDATVAGRFFSALRERWQGHVALEPRHATWFTASANALLDGYRVARVVADPARAEGGEYPGGWRELVYYRLHGSPRTYYSSYDERYIATLAERLVAHSDAGATVWCIFDNTASGAAAANALELLRLVG